MNSERQMVPPPPPPPPPAPQPMHYILGQGLGIRPMNAIRRNLVYPPTIPVQRFSTYEPIPLPPGLEHLNHMPQPKLVNGGRDYHGRCGVGQLIVSETRQPWRAHHSWVTKNRIKREQRREKNFVEISSMDLEKLPESMKLCYNRIAEKWQKQGVDVPIISGSESFVSKSDPNATEAPLPGFRKSYERFSNHLGWKTKAQVFGKSNEPNLTQNGES